MEWKISLGQNLILVMLLLGQLHGYKSCIVKEKKALFMIKKFMISTSEEDQSDSVFSTWTNDKRSDCCQWKGVKCNRTSGRIIELSIGGFYHKESSLLNLSLLHPFEEIRSLDLSGFSFSGLFDDVEGYKSLRRLRNLETLDLSYNEFNNSIFPFLNTATSLTKLRLRRNKMDGPFPAKEIKDLTNLELLDIRINLFNGSIPVQDLHILKRLRNLENLDLSFNQFDNNIFRTLNAITSLTTLFLRQNNLGGPSPVNELYGLVKLKALDLSGNEFSGSMEFQGICKLKNMEELDLSKNKLVGQFPLCLTSLTRLRVLDLSSNYLTGKLPSALSNLESLEYLSLFDNDFEGLFSLDWLLNLSKLKVLKLDSQSNSLHVESESLWNPKFQLNVIALRSCNLEKVPHFLLSQTDLRQVDLSYNSIDGSFPLWLLANNTKLKVFRLENNSFTNFQLPESSHGLIFLDVSVNEFKNLFPENIGWIFPHLEYLNISKNGFQGNMPSSLGNLKSLRYLDISHNSFQGKLPTSFVKGCYSLEILKLSHNKLSGEISPRSTNFTYVYLLAMDNNQFTGTIGQGLRRLISLQLLDISNNNLTGVIPSWFGKFEVLEALLISNNMLEGEIPISLFNGSYFQLLDLSANNLTGDIPQHVNVTYPTQLFLQYNKLTGVIPDTMLASVQVLDLRNNRLSGNIPEFTNTEDISVLLLRGNNLTGSIPSLFCGLRNIQLLDLSNNRLNGSIPSCLSNTSFGRGKEDTLYGYDSELRGIFDGLFNVDVDVKSLLMLYSFGIDYTTATAISVEFATKYRYDTYIGGNLELLFGLDLSENELSGEIPIDLGGLLELQSLNISRNNLSGMIPESFSNLKNVESLDLSFNILQGQIPPQLTDIKSLAVFNVSYNNLSGAIPQGGQFNTFDMQSYLGNPFLCGLLTNTSCNDIKFQEPDNDEAKTDESVIDMVSFYWSFAAAYVTILLGILVSFLFDSRWSRAWFYIVDVFIHKARNLLW